MKWWEKGCYRMTRGLGTILACSIKHSQVCCVKLNKLYYRVTSKYWSWKRRRCRQRHEFSSVLDDWDQVGDWTPTYIVNDITLPSHDEYYDIDYPYYRNALEVNHAASPNTDVHLMNEINPPKVRSKVRKPKTEPVRFPTKALFFDSGANIHIINNPNFLSCNRSYIDQWINTTGFCT